MACNIINLEASADRKTTCLDFLFDLLASKNIKEVSTQFELVHLIEINLKDDSVFTLFFDIYFIL